MLQEQRLKWVSKITISLHLETALKEKLDSPAFRIWYNLNNYQGEIELRKYCFTSTFFYEEEYTVNWKERHNNRC